MFEQLCQCAQAKQRCYMNQNVFHGYFVLCFVEFALSAICTYQYKCNDIQWRYVSLVSNVLQLRIKRVAVTQGCGLCLTRDPFYSPRICLKFRTCCTESMAISKVRTNPCPKSVIEEDRKVGCRLCKLKRFTLLMSSNMVVRIHTVLCTRNVLNIEYPAVNIYFLLTWQIYMQFECNRRCQ